MFGATKNVYADMQNQADVQNSNKVELVVLVYEKIISHLNIAAKAVEEKKIQEKIYHIGKAIHIIEMGLIAYLDMSAGDVAKNLKEFYLSAIYVLTKANLDNNAKDIESIAVNFNNIRTAWKQIA